MRLLVVADDLASSSLSEAALWLGDVVAHWAERGHRVDVLCRHDEDNLDAGDDPPRVRVLRPVESEFEIALGELLEHPPDLVHVASAGPFGPRVVESLQELPLLLDVHDFWAICPSDDLLRRPRFRPCGEHFPYPGCGACAGLTRLRAMDERAELARQARAVVAHSTFARVRLNAGLGRPIEVLDYGVNLDTFQPEPGPPLSPDVAEMLSRRDGPRVLFLGPPSLRRGAGLIVDLLVAFRSRLPGIELVVAGRDPENPDGVQVILAEAKELGVHASLRLMPRVLAHDLPALHLACDVGIAPTIAAEPGGLFVEQALACGLPVVASPVGAHEDLIRPGDGGLLLSIEDVPAFAEGVSRVLLDPALREQLAHAARLRALERHDRSRSMAALEDIYERLREGTRFRTAA